MLSCVHFRYAQILEDPGCSQGGSCVLQVVSSIHNLIIGKIYVDHGGVMRITSSATGMVCKLKFKEQGLLSRHEAHEVRRVFTSPQTTFLGFS